MQRTDEKAVNGIGPGQGPGVRRRVEIRAARLRRERLREQAIAYRAGERLAEGRACDVPAR